MRTRDPNPSLALARAIAALKEMTVPELQARHAAVFGEETRIHHRDLLVKRIAWRLQALAEGDLTERAKKRAAELANDADIRVRPLPPPSGAPPARVPAPAKTRREPRRLPMPGTVLTRVYKGKAIEVAVLPHGFEYDGRVYKSLSAVAKTVTGTHWNGFYFFGIGKEPTHA